MGVPPVRCAADGTVCPSAARCGQARTRATRLLSAPRDSILAPAWSPARASVTPRRSPGTPSPASTRQPNGSGLVTVTGMSRQQRAERRTCPAGCWSAVVCDVITSSPYWTLAACGSPRAPSAGIDRAREQAAVKGCESGERAARLTASTSQQGHPGQMTTGLAIGAVTMSPRPEPTCGEGGLNLASHTAYQRGLDGIIRAGPLGDVPGASNLIRVRLLDPDQAPAADGAEITVREENLAARAGQQPGTASGPRRRRLILPLRLARNTPRTPAPGPDTTTNRSPSCSYMQAVTGSSPGRPAPEDAWDDRSHAASARVHARRSRSCSATTVTSAGA